MSEEIHGDRRLGVHVEGRSFFISFLGMLWMEFGLRFGLICMAFGYLDD